MPYLIATDRPILWAVGNPIVASGSTEPGGATVTGLPLISDADENTFLGAVTGLAGTYNPLPAMGEWCDAGVIYGYAGGLVICRQSHTRTEHAPADIPALFAVYRVDAGEALAWVAGEQVWVGTRRLYAGVLYTALQAHQTQADWTPNAPGILGVLWAVVVTTPDWAIGVLYHVGDLVMHQGTQYRCLQQHTSIASWSPTSPGILGVLWAVA